MIERLTPETDEYANADWWTLFRATEHARKLERERDEARQEWGKASMDAAQLLSEKTKVIAERDEAREAAAKWEAVALREASINGARICAKEAAK